MKDDKLNQILSCIGYELELIREINKPLVYIRHSFRGTEIWPNSYKQDSHPNDPNKYIKGTSKGRAIGLEQSGFIGYIPILKKL